MINHEGEAPEVQCSAYNIGVKKMKAPTLGLRVLVNEEKRIRTRVLLLLGGGG
jgi:hypothetical protein